jgi:SAM-dependent methyltransferase
VVVTAVLEHVIDPYRCVAEIHRVLKPGGLVYAETPFMQQVHGGRYDYVRFTDLGHRRLFRDFEEIERGVAVGPGSALMWSVNAFMRTVFRRHLFKQLATAAVQATLFWLRYFDYYLVDRPAAADCASGYYFLGRKSDKPLSDKELLEQYRGACYELRAY